MLWPPIDRFSKGKPLYLYFVLMISVVMLADAVMSYAAPLYIESLVGNETEMGLILATSSIAGICMDFLFAKLFPSKKSAFFLRILFPMVFFFPLSFLLFSNVFASVVGMIAWGIYFEAIVFANFHAVHETVVETDHPWAWGITAILRNLALVIGPLIASSFHDIEPTLPLRASILIYAAGLLLAFGYWWLTKDRKMSKFVGSAASPDQKSREFGQELKIWRIYERVLWPLLGLFVLFYIIESAFYSVGPLFAEKITTLGAPGWLFVSLYSIPGLVVGFFLARASKPLGKKRLAYLGGILAGLGFLAMAMTNQPWIILFWTFCASVGLCFLHPALSATFEDYVSRAKKFGNDMVGLTAVAGSIAYVVGPILNGWLADRFGNQAVFGILGAVTVCYCVVLFFIVPRKITLPVPKV